MLCHISKTIELWQLTGEHGPAAYSTLVGKCCYYTYDICSRMVKGRKQDTLLSLRCSSSQGQMLLMYFDSFKLCRLTSMACPVSVL